MKRMILIFLLVTSACRPAPPNLSPQGTVAFQNSQVAKVLDLLRDTAIDANKQVPPILSTSTTRKVVLYHESALKIINVRASGWKIVLTTSLDETIKDLPPKEAMFLAPYIAMAKTVIMEIN